MRSSERGALPKDLLCGQRRFQAWRQWRRPGQRIPPALWGQPNLERMRRCAARGTPFGDAAWVQWTAAALGLEFTLHSAGRPTGSRPSGLRGVASPGLFDVEPEGYESKQ